MTSKVKGRHSKAIHGGLDSAAHQGAAADETGFMRDVGRRHRTVAETQGVLLRVAGVETALTRFAGLRCAVRHAGQRPVETRRRDAAIRA